MNTMKALRKTTRKRAARELTQSQALVDLEREVERREKRLLALTMEGTRQLNLSRERGYIPCEDAPVLCDASAEYLFSR
jgi:hypothetical protein